MATSTFTLLLLSCIVVVYANTDDTASVTATGGPNDTFEPTYPTDPASTTANPSDTVAPTYPDPTTAGPSSDTVPPTYPDPTTAGPSDTSTAGPSDTSLPTFPTAGPSDEALPCHFQGTREEWEARHTCHTCTTLPTNCKEFLEAALGCGAKCPESLKAFHSASLGECQADGSAKFPTRPDNFDEPCSDDTFTFSPTFPNPTAGPEGSPLDGLTGLVRQIADLMDKKDQCSYLANEVASSLEHLLAELAPFFLGPAPHPGHPGHPNLPPFPSPEIETLGPHHGPHGPKHRGPKPPKHPKHPMPSHPVTTADGEGRRLRGVNETTEESEYEYEYEYEYEEDEDEEEQSEEEEDDDEDEENDDDEEERDEDEDEEDEDEVDEDEDEEYEEYEENEYEYEHEYEYESWGNATWTEYEGFGGFDGHWEDALMSLLCTAEAECLQDLVQTAIKFFSAGVGDADFPAHLVEAGADFVQHMLPGVEVMLEALTSDVAGFQESMCQDFSIWFPEHEWEEEEWSDDEDETEDGAVVGEEDEEDEEGDGNDEDEDEDGLSGILVKFPGQGAAQPVESLNGDQLSDLIDAIGDDRLDRSLGPLFGRRGPKWTRVQQTTIITKVVTKKAVGGFGKWGVRTVEKLSGCLEGITFDHLAELPRGTVVGALPNFADVLGWTFAQARALADTLKSSEARRLSLRTRNDRALGDGGKGKKGKKATFGPDLLSWTKEEVAAAGTVCAGLSPKDLLALPENSLLGLTPAAIQKIADDAELAQTLAGRVKAMDAAVLKQFSAEQRAALNAHHPTALAEPADEDKPASASPGLLVYVLVGVGSAMAVVAAVAAVLFVRRRRRREALRNPAQLEDGREVGLSAGGRPVSKNSPMEFLPAAVEQA